MTRQRRPRAVSGFGLIVGAAIFAAFGIGHLATDSGKGVGKSSALGQFRKAVPHPVGYEGVYIYSTTGQESTSGPGGVVHHPYAPTTPITVIRTGCGVRLQWEPLEGSSMTWRLCASKGGVTLRAVGQTHTFLKKTESANYTCSQSALQFTCTGGDGAESGSIESVGETTVSVSGEMNDAMVVRTVATVTGRSHGTETMEWWLAPRTLLPLRVDITNKTTWTTAGVGTVHYRENATLVLVSRKPAR